MLSFQLKQIDECVFHPFFLSLIISLLFSIYILIKWRSNPSSKRTLLPPSPPKLPILGNLHQLSRLAHRSFQSLGTKYGPVMLLHFGSRPVVVVQSAEAAMEIMKTHDLVYASKPATRLSRRLLYDLKDISVSPYGEYWRKMKSICVLQLLSNKRVQSFQYIREEETDLLIKDIKSCSYSCSAPVNLSELFTSLSNDVICRSAFGRKYSEGEQGKKFLILITELLELLGSLSIGDYIPCLSWINRVNGFNARVDRVSTEIDDFLNQVIQQHQMASDDDTIKGERRETFLNILLQIYYKDNTTDVSIDKDNIKAIILDIFAGGTDTTSATLAWAMTELLRHPIVMNKLQIEIREIMGDKHDITNNDLEKMHYLKAVVKETLRYHTPVTLSAREAREDATVMGYDIAAGTMILINAWAIGRDPASWDEPEKFQPERFLHSSIGFQGLDFELLPFGAGRRRCPGITFAMANVELVLANLLQKFDWELPEGMKNEDLDTIEHLGVTTHRENPLFAVATHCYF
ncbi:hypothetical protein RD792_004803 [Penstemon davidsonii]|uniref:Cytochrome P450 n=1 Tax=Penstemon davidsonii TaxID=160366 RepID=A0ABR0DJH2_9LAMI|nr:hypothetical protein RD792_004803 [Penstemon davidsonii]